MERKNMLDVLADTGPEFANNLSLMIGIPAILVIVPMLVVGIPAGIVSFLVAGGTAMVTKENMGAVFLAEAPVFIVAMLCFAVVYNAIRVGWTRVMLKLAEGQPTGFAELTASLPWLMNFILVCMIMGFATLIGGFLFVVPGVYIAVRTCMAPFLVVDENLGPIQAIIRSNDLVTGYAWQIALYILLYFVGNAIAGFVPFLGFFIAIPLMGYFDFALARAYVMLKNTSAFEHNAVV